MFGPPSVKGVPPLTPALGEPVASLETSARAHRPGSSRLLVRDSLFSIGASAIDAAGAVVVSVLIGRLLGARPTGVYGYAQALAGMLLAIFGLGIPALLAQRIAQAAPSGLSWVPVLRSGLSVFAAFSAPAAIAVFAAIWSFGGSRLGSVVAVVSALVSAFGLAVAGIALGCGRARGDFLTPVRASAFTKSALVAAILSVAFLGLGIEGYMVSAAVVQAGVALVLVRRLQRTVGADVIRRPVRQDLVVVRDALPFAFMVVLEVVFFRGDTLLVEWFRGGVETGWYVAAYTVYTLPILVSYSVASAYYPWVTRARASAVGVGRASALALGIVTLYGLVAALLCYLLAPWLVQLAFGSAFEPSVAPLRILALAVPFVSANRLGLMDLKGAGRIRGALVSSFVATIVSIAGNVAVLETYGIRGAAWVNVATEVVMLACVLALGAWRGTGRPERCPT
jgi:O-antigen/teichoic acid export membrane protein